MTSTDVDQIEKALVYLRHAKHILTDAGIPEQLFPLAVDVASEEWGRSFWKFGSDVGPFIQFRTTSIPHEVVVSFGIVWKRSFFRRLYDCICECFAILWRKERTYNVHLQDQQVIEFKNMLRRL